ncbi:MAG: hypothetical protein SPL43_05180 [Prevotella sp.]|nr:hypothetical protein [Prevotella sp.]
MSLLVIKPGKRFPPLPRVICIDNQPLCMMKGQPIAISLPAGTYKVTVRSGGFRFIEGSVMVSLDAASERRMTVGDREKWWNAVFNIDLAYWFITLFLHIGQPWSTVYDVLSYGFFTLWLVRLWLIRKHYYAMTVA